MGKRALVVDDNECSLMLAKDLLEVAGFEVFEAGNATIGMAIARKVRPDVIIMDVRLPDMRGSEAVRILRGCEETIDIPVIFVTASVLPEGRAEIKDIRKSLFIGKPINTRSFASEIDEFIKSAGGTGWKNDR